MIDLADIRPGPAHSRSEQPFQLDPLGRFRQLLQTPPMRSSNTETFSIEIELDALSISHVAPMPAKLASISADCRPIQWPIQNVRSGSPLGSHDQYTTIVRSKPAQMVLNHPKSRRPQR